MARKNFKRGRSRSRARSSNDDNSGATTTTTSTTTSDQFKLGGPANKEKVRKLLDKAKVQVTKDMPTGVEYVDKLFRDQEEVVIERPKMKAPDTASPHDLTEDERKDKDQVEAYYAKKDQ